MVSPTKGLEDTFGFTFVSGVSLESPEIATSSENSLIDSLEDLAFDPSPIEDKHKEQERFQQEAIDTAERILKNLLKDFAPHLFLGNSSALQYTQEKLLTFLSENKKEILGPLIITQPGSLKSPEKTLLKYNFETLTHFLEDYAAAVELYKKRSDRATIPLEDTENDILNVNAEPNSTFESFFNQRRAENNSSLLFEDENIANVEISKKLLSLFRGVFSLAFEEDPQKCEGLARVVSPVMLVLLDNAIEPENICLLLKRFISIISKPEIKEGVHEKEKEPQQVYIDFQQLNEMCGQIKSLLESTFKIIDLNDSVKKVLAYGLDPISHLISSLILSEMERSKQNEICLTPFILLQKLLYTEENGKQSSNFFLNSTEEEKKKLVDNMEKSFENLISILLSTVLSKAPRILSKTILDSCLSLGIHKHLVYLLKSPIFIKLLLCDILEATTKALSQIRNNSYNKATLLALNSSSSNALNLERLIKPEYSSQTESHNISFSKSAPSVIESSLFESTFSKITRIVTDLAATPPIETRPKARQISPPTNWVEVWSKPLASKSSVAYSNNQKKVAHFTQELFEKILKDYVLDFDTSNSPVMRFARSQLLSYFHDYAHLFIPLMTNQKPRRIENTPWPKEQPLFFKPDEKIYLNHILKASSFFFESYAYALNTLRYLKTDVNEDELLKHLHAYRKGKKGIPFNRSVTQEDLYRTLMHLQQLLSLIGRKKSNNSLPKTVQEIGGEIALTGVILKLVEIFTNPHHILYIIHRIATEDIVWNIGIDDSFPKIPLDSDFLKSLTSSFKTIFQSIVPLGSPGPLFESLLDFLLSNVQSWSQEAAAALLQQIGELLMSDNASRPFIILNFLLFKNKDGQSIPILKNEAPEKHYQLKEIQESLIKRLDLFILTEIDKQNFVKRNLLKAAISLTREFSTNCIKEILFLTQQPKILNLMLWDLLEGVEQALNEIINASVERGLGARG